MDKEKKSPKEQAEATYAEANYPGAAVNEADHNKNTEKLHDERTCTLNNNPRNNELDK